ncbi:hypothetical protein ACFS07_29900 [Undibacterium arcticum]
MNDERQIRKTMKHKLIGSCIVAALIQALCVAPSHAHGFVGKRFFPATIAIDDPFVADELSFVAGHRKLPPEDNGGGDEAGLPAGNPGIHATTFFHRTQQADHARLWHLAQRHLSARQAER